jgi:hypothetical protein
MTDHNTSPGKTNDDLGQPTLTGRIDQVADAAAVTKPNARPRIVVTPLPITVKGQKYIPPAGRHSQLSHRRAQERSAAQGHSTIQEQHDHDRSMVKAEISRIAALKVTQKPNPPK